MESIGEDERVTSALASLTELFGQCVLDVWTPLRSDARDRLAELFEDAIASIAQDLEQSGFGLKLIQSLLYNEHS